MKYNHLPLQDRQASHVLHTTG